MFAWFDTKAAATFGDTLADFFMERLPLELKADEKKFKSKTIEVMGKMNLQVDQFKQQQRLNLFQKAKLGNTFRWKLVDAGYDPTYVSELVRWLMLRVG